MFRNVLLAVFILVMFGYISCTKEAVLLSDTEQEKIDQQLIREYLVAKNLTGFKTDSTAASTDSKLWYKILDTTTVDTPDLVNSSSIVYVRYKAQLLNGTVFDEKIDTAGYRLSSTIQGWRIGLTTFLKKKGEIRLIIPSRIAFGKYSQPNIPANSVVDYQIKLDSIGN